MADVTLWLTCPEQFVKRSNFSRIAVRIAG